MPRVGTLAGGTTIGAWTAHCPQCSARVTVHGEEAVACPECSAVFQPRAVETAAGRPASPAPSDPDDSLVGRRLGRWTLTRLVGRGGMGRVYEGQEAGGRRVAVKVLPEEIAGDSSFVRRFQREARLLSTLSHPHVVEVLDQGQDEGRLWFAMEYVRGENLRRRMEHGKLPLAEAVRVASEVAAALEYAHGRDVVHRDLKPENVLLDEEGRVRLVDFGLSRMRPGEAPDATTRLTRTDVILGTYEYMAPEQRRGERDLDGRADVFALGVILYEMLTGMLPLGHFTPPSEIVPGVPRGVDAVVNRALAPERGARFGTAEEFRLALIAAARERPGAIAAPARSAGPVPRQDVEEARGILKHVEILGALDRVLGVLLLLGFFGMVSVGFFRTTLGLWLVPVSGVVLLIASIVFFRLGRRLTEMAPRSREGQVTASVVLLFFPPVLTAMGIYGLLVLTTERARKAFALGKNAFLGPRVVVERPVVVVPPAPRIERAGMIRHLLAIAAMAWFGIVGLTYVDALVVTPAPAWQAVASMDAVRSLSLIGLAVSAVVAAQAFLQRRHRRGLGLALTAVFFFACAVAWASAGVREAKGTGVAAHRRPAPWSRSFVPSSFPAWESHR